MKVLTSSVLTVCLDERFPRIISYRTPDGSQSLVGQRLAAQPRLYLFEKSARRTFTSDDAEVVATYTFQAGVAKAMYQGAITVDGQAAAEFDVVMELAGADLVVRLQNVREHGTYRFLTIRFEHLVSATTLDPQSMLITCGFQGRLLDPAKCKPLLIDYSWVSFYARLCGAAYRPGLMVTIDIPGYEDLLVQEVWQYSRIADSESLSSLGAELMYRQREVGGPREYRFLPPADKMPDEEVLDEPLLCGKTKEVRLHAICSGKAALDWTDAARYFQSLLPAGAECNSRYDNTLVYKIMMARRERGLVSVSECEAIIRRVANLSDGAKQVCYLAFFQYKGEESGFPEMFEIYPPLGTKDDVRRLIQTGKTLNAVVSFHENLNVYENESPSFDPRYTMRTVNGRMFCGWVLDGFELFSISMPAFKEQAIDLLKRVFADYGITETYHLDTFNCAPYLFDANPRRPYNATQFVQSHLDILTEINKSCDVDITSEGLTEPFIGRIGHSWRLFAEGTAWEGEQVVPFANFIYHGAASWNSGTGTSEKDILDGLVQGGAAGVEFPSFNCGAVELVDSLHLLQPPYGLLRHRRWTGYRKVGSIVRVDYASAGGRESFIEVDYAKPGYRVVVDGALVAEDFVTLYAGPRSGTHIAFSRNDRQLDWPAPAGWGEGSVPAITLTDSGPGLLVSAEVKNGRLKVSLKAHQPVRIGPRA